MDLNYVYQVNPGEQTRPNGLPTQSFRQGQHRLKLFNEVSINNTLLQNYESLICHLDYLMPKRALDRHFQGFQDIRELLANIFSALMSLHLIHLSQINAR